MVREIAVFEVREGQEEDFAGAYKGAAHLLEEAEGCRGAALHRGVESPSVYTLIVEWDSVRAHEALTKTPEFDRFGEAIGPYLAGHPTSGTPSRWPRKRPTIMPEAIGFDIYGTLVDPLEMNERLRPLAGGKADRLSELWREKQIEYSWRRALMREYADFGVCTRQALLFASRSLDVNLSEQEQEKLIEQYQDLRVFPDVVPGLKRLRAEGHALVAFSNGVERTARTLLERGGALSHLDAVVSVDDLGTFKPDPEVYRYLARRLRRPVEEVWLVSSNPWDVIGAKSAGLRAAWLKRRPEAVFDPWGVEPDIVTEDLERLADRLR